jgi:hypothetical protein
VPLPFPETRYNPRFSFQSSAEHEPASNDTTNNPQSQRPITLPSWPDQPPRGNDRTANTPFTFTNLPNAPFSHGQSNPTSSITHADLNPNFASNNPYSSVASPSSPTTSTISNPSLTTSRLLSNPKPHPHPLIPPVWVPNRYSTAPGHKADMVGMSTKETPSAAPKLGPQV